VKIRSGVEFICRFGPILSLPSFLARLLWRGVLQLRSIILSTPGTAANQKGPATGVISNRSLLLAEMGIVNRP